MSTTTRTVDGVQVIAEEPVESPLSTPDRPVYFTRIRRLLLADETTVLACTECEFTADAPGKVRSHLGNHSPESRPGRKRRGATPAEPSRLDITLGELLDAHRRAEVLMATVERQAAELSEARRRYRAAERDLETLRRVLNGAVKG